jgi:ribose 5-phosphate isomerase B
VGVYCYRTGAMFLNYATIAQSNNVRTNNEFYVAPMYNLLIGDGLKVGIHRIDKMYVLGTPEDLQFYERYVARYQTIERFALCCDHSGFVLKEALRRYLDEQRIPYTDFGAYSPADSDHHDYLKPCTEYLLTANNTMGIAVCHTGQGFNIAANKVKGLRSAIILDPHTAEMSRRHNAANFFCISSRMVTADQLPGIIDAVVNSTFDGGRHATRIQKFTRDHLLFSE